MIKANNVIVSSDSKGVCKPVEPQPTRAIEVFYSYAHEDEKLCDELEKHLANLRRQRIIASWYDHDISGGKQWDDEIKNHLDRATVILLLISPDFMTSDYCNDVEVARAMERHEAGEARLDGRVLACVGMALRGVGTLL